MSYSRVQAQSIPSKKVFITIDADAKSLLSNKLTSGIVEHASSLGTLILEVDEAILPKISEMMHDEFYGRGGYIVHEGHAAANKFLNPNLHKSVSLADYSINENEIVQAMVAKRSSYKNGLSLNGLIF